MKPRGRILCPSSHPATGYIAFSFSTETIGYLFHFSHISANCWRGRNVSEVRRRGRSFASAGITRLSAFVRVRPWAKIIASEHTHIDLSSVILMAGIGRHGSVQPLQKDFRHIIITSFSCFVLSPSVPPFHHPFTRRQVMQGSAGSRSSFALPEGGPEPLCHHHDFPHQP